MICCYLEATWEDFSEGTKRNDFLAWYGAYVIWRERNGLYLLQKQILDSPRASKLPPFPLFAVRKEDLRSFAATDFRQRAEPSMLFHLLESLCLEKAILIRNNWSASVLFVPPNFLPRVCNTNGMTVLHKDGSDISVDVNAQGSVIGKSNSSAVLTNSLQRDDVLLNVVIVDNAQVDAGAVLFEVVAVLNDLLEVLFLQSDSGE